MNHAYVDGSFDDGAETGQAGRSGFGIVLIMPGQLPQHLYGRMEAGDNNAAELRAVTEALRHAPTGEALTVHTDNLSVLSAIRRGSRSIRQHEEAVRVRGEAEARQIELHLARASRERRHMQTAHALANDARLERSSTAAPSPHAEVNLSHAPWRDSAVVTLRRSGERVSAEVPREPDDPLARSVRALLVAVQLASPGETLIVSHASKLAVALWQNPKRALLGAAQEHLMTAREHIKLHNIQLFFERIDGER
ncbi:ribonuclease H-like domain-containing protein [Deinococcus detaillensis]|uniref:Ribonuclease H-like domain-containing protein n=1 Tax=Deinococcus detaillensis TaxID=2592048 RepID=A0A553UUI9_9DEIO|nr:ribonuclease H family protein [Deinococcus detaillensis]TSA83691.1 ribonuclease H-like domain-containing protein [Deinococcus detaillensis]